MYFKISSVIVLSLWKNWLHFNIKYKWIWLFSLIFDGTWFNIELKQNPEVVMKRAIYKSEFNQEMIKINLSFSSSMWMWLTRLFTYKTCSIKSRTSSLLWWNNQYLCLMIFLKWGSWRINNILSFLHTLIASASYQYYWEMVTFLFESLFLLKGIDWLYPHHEISILSSGLLLLVQYTLLIIYNK